MRGGLTGEEHWEFESLNVTDFLFVVVLEILLAQISLNNTQFSVNNSHSGFLFSFLGSFIFLLLKPILS
jgi:hypothetical protein